MNTLTEYLKRVVGTETVSRRRNTLAIVMGLSAALCVASWMQQSHWWLDEHHVTTVGTLNGVIMYSNVYTIRQYNQFLQRQHELELQASVPLNTNYLNPQP